MTQYVGLLLVVLVGWVVIVDACKYLMTQEAYDRTTSLMKADTAAVMGLPGVRAGSRPIWKLHRVGSYVHGTVVVLHGFGLNAITSAQQAEYLFNAGFNVYAGNLPGFAQIDKYWLSTTLRNSKGYTKVRTALLNDARIQNAIRLLSGNGTSPQDLQQLNGTKLISVIREVVKRELPTNLQNDVLSAFDLLSPLRSATGGSFNRLMNKYYFSEHAGYESAISALSLVQPLPGPLYMLGFSFGGTNIVNVAARSGSVARAVLLAPFFGNRGATSDLSHMLIICGAVDLFKFRQNGVVVPLKAGTASNVFVQLATSDEILRTARESTQMLCIFAEDDFAIDVVRTREVCDSKLGGRSLVYPRSLGLSHSITPERRSKYSNAMMQQVVSFFVNGTASQSNLLTPNS